MGASAEAMEVGEEVENEEEVEGRMAGGKEAE